MFLDYTFHILLFSPKLLCVILHLHLNERVIRNETLLTHNNILSRKTLHGPIILCIFAPYYIIGNL